MGMSVTSGGYCSMSSPRLKPTWTPVTARIAHHLKNVQCIVLIRFQSHSIYLNSQWKATSAFSHISAFGKVFSQLNLLYQSETHTHIYTGNSYGSVSEFFSSRGIWMETVLLLWKPVYNEQILLQDVLHTHLFKPHLFTTEITSTLSCFYWYYGTTEK